MTTFPIKRLGFFTRLLDQVDAAERYRLATQQIVQAEKCGFDSAWIAQHHFHEGEGGLPAPFVFLAHAAAHTSRIRLGTGVSVASVIHMRQTLDAKGFNACRIVASSGFNLFKCKMFSNARAPVDVVGTGSFIPENLGDTFATADIFMYDGEFGIKLGREKLFQGLKP